MCRIPPSVSHCLTIPTVHLSWCLIPSTELGSAAALISANPPPSHHHHPQVMESGSLVRGSRAAGLSLAVSLVGMCRWTRNKSIFRAQHMLAVVHSKIVSCVRLRHQMNCGGMGEGKASMWVWHSNCYHTWQCLVWDPVVHAAYVSGWSSVRQSDRVWRVTRHIRPCQRMCLTEHRNFTPAQCFVSTHIVRATW